MFALSYRAVLRGCPAGAYFGADCTPCRPYREPRGSPRRGRHYSTVAASAATPHPALLITPRGPGPPRSPKGFQAATYRNATRNVLATRSGVVVFAPPHRKAMARHSPGASPAASWLPMMARIARYVPDSLFLKEPRGLSLNDDRALCSFPGHDRRTSQPVSKTHRSEFGSSGGRRTWAREARVGASLD